MPMIELFWEKKLTTETRDYFRGQLHHRYLTRFKLDPCSVWILFFEFSKVFKLFWTIALEIFFSLHLFVHLFLSDIAQYMGLPTVC